MKNNPTVQALTDIISSDRGSFAVLFAITLMVMISVMAFALDLGYFTRVKSNYQACADSAALSGAENLCYGRAVESAEFVAYGSDVLLPEDSVKVEFGFYDAYDEHENFKTYQDFIQEDDEDYPPYEANNAVLVTIENTVQALTGLNEEKTIKAAAVAYLPRVSIVAGGTFSNKGTPSIGLYKFKMNNGNIFSGEKMTLYGPRLGSNIKVASDESIEVYEMEFIHIGPIWKWFPIPRKSDILPEMNIIKKHILADPENTMKEYMEKMKAIADIVYTANEEPGDGYYYHKKGYSFYLDLTKAHEDHEIIFFDGEGVNGIVFIDPYGLHPGVPHEPFGSSIKNITFVTNCRIYLVQIRPGKEQIPIDGSGLTPVTFVSTKKISCNLPNRPLRGFNFYCRDFEMLSDNSLNYKPQDTDINIRGIALNDVKILSQAHEPLISNFNFKFGPPCPPVAPVALGRLVRILVK